VVTPIERPIFDGGRLLGATGCLVDLAGTSALGGLAGVFVRSYRPGEPGVHFVARRVEFGKQ
jgi:hypothetical protein